MTSATSSCRSDGAAERCDSGSRNLDSRRRRRRDSDGHAVWSGRRIRSTRAPLRGCLPRRGDPTRGRYRSSRPTRRRSRRTSDRCRRRRVAWRGRFWPGPLTLAAARARDARTRASVRAPAASASECLTDHIARAVAAAAGTPVTATSANRERRAGDGRSGRRGAHARTTPSIFCWTRADAGRRAVDDRRRHRRDARADSGRCDFLGRDSRMPAASRLARPERAALVGLITGRTRRLEAERSLDELAGLAAGRRRRGRASRAAGASEAGSGDVPRRRQGQDARRLVRRNGGRRRDRRQRADAGAAPPDRGGRRSQGRRSHAADSRHLRAPRAHARGQAAGGAGAAEVSAAAAGRRRRRRCRGSAAASARADPAKRSSKPIAAASGREFTPSASDIEQVRQRRAQLRERRHKASVPTVALVGYTNAGKTTLFNELTRGQGRGVQRAVRDARSARPAGPPAGQPRAAHLGYGRIHRPPAARAGGGVPGDARRGRRGRPRAARDRRGGAGSRSAHGRGATACWRKSARPTCRCSRSTTSATRSRPTSGAACGSSIRRR